MAPGDIVDADATALVIAWLKMRRSELTPPGQPFVGISGMVEGPWPHIRVLPPQASDLRGMNGASLVELVIIEVYGSPEGNPGLAELRKIALRAIREIKALEDIPPMTLPGMGVAKLVRPLTLSASTSSPAESSLSAQTTVSGQSVWRCTLEITLGPPV